MKILSLDLATRLTGWCCGRGNEVPLCGAWELRSTGDDIGEMLIQLDDYLHIAFQRFAPEAVVFEAPILVVRGRYGAGRTDRLGVVRKLYNLGGHVEFYCKRRGIPCFEVDLHAIKKEVTGNAFAEKDDMVAVARKVGLELPPGPGAKDAADAWGAWLIGVRHFTPKLSEPWDRRIWTPRGALL